MKRGLSLILGTFLVSYFTLVGLKSNKIVPSQIIPDTTITKTITDPDSLLIQTINEEFEKLKPMSKGWVNLFSIDDDVRVVFDINTIEVTDTINDNKRAREKYFNKLRKISQAEYDNHKSFLGRKSKIQEAFNLYDKYKNILRQPLLEEGLPLILSYIPLTETHMTNAASNAQAVGFWQLKRGTAGNLMMNTYVDERRSPIISSERAAKFLAGLYNIYPEWKLTATAYIRGPKGQAEDLEKMLGLNKPGRLFDSYSNMVSFNQPTDFTKYDFKTFSNLISVNKPTLWNQTYKSFKGNRKERKEKTNFKLYLDYITDFTGEQVIDTSSVVLKKTDSKMISFFDYYDLEDTDIYLQYYNFLKTTENNFSTPQYVPETIALAWMHNNGFQYEKAKPIKIKEIELKPRQVKEFVKKNGEWELNGHIKSRAIRRNYVPKGTVGYVIVK